MDPPSAGRTRSLVGLWHFLEQSQIRRLWPRIRASSSSTEEAIRGWTLQSSVLDELRNRTGILLSAASVASAFLGSADLTRHPSASWLSALAFVAFAVVVVLCVYVLWPTKGWCFAHESGAVTQSYIKKGKSLDYMYENLARPDAIGRRSSSSSSATPIGLASQNDLGYLDGTRIA